MFGESGCEDLTILEVDSLSPLGALVGDGLLLYVTVPGVDPPNLLVLAGEEDLGSVPVPAGAQHELRQLEVDQTLARPHVPDADVVVAASGEEDVLGGGVPQHNAHPPLVEHEVHHALGHGPGDAPVGDLPHFHGAVLASRG